MARLLQTLFAVLDDADAARVVCVEHAQRDRDRQLRADKARLDEEFERLQRRRDEKIANYSQTRDFDIQEAETRYSRRLAEITQLRDESLREADRRHTPRMEELQTEHENQRRRLEQNLQQRLHAAQEAHEAQWNEIATAWRQGVRRISAEVAEINQASQETFPSWDDPAWEDWRPSQTPPAGIRFGEVDIAVEAIPGAAPEDPRLQDAQLSDFSLPALAPFPRRPSLIYKASGAGRDVAVESLQTVMLRMLTALPPGKTRFTIIDPVGLGENFAAFMHLADYDEALVSSRIWTEPEHIEQRLADLTEHLENVIQTYLRNQFETIEEYNRDAGEVAEPFRVLVVANFPTNFSDAAMRRLVSIASSGPRCGVYTLLTVDTKKKTPASFDLKDLEQHANVLRWDGERFVWQDDDFRPFPLRLEAPPAPDRFSLIVRGVGEHAKDANKVEVPFEYIIPEPEAWWTADASKTLDGPLGRAGATKLQHLVLGPGTSQHVLVAGKTGSGKSTLLHVLITSLALRYRPEEVQFYLVDFKKGVEFKTYATHQLPHARVVAVESEREFGLSVLQRLDEELRVRGDAFRRHGVQDLASYRRAAGEPLPRLLLIVDEFQELFVEDDRLAQDASLLLDRLVRQGRAFGIHVLLGSQTLGGAYSLARATLGQMAVRIALECSEADASLILAEGNTAARLLARPGEAIYNDANGRIEGNKPFQVCWLSDESRESYLGRVRDLAKRHDYAPAEPQIVFEGNVPADLAGNHLLQQLLEQPNWPAPARVVYAWMGEPVAIKAPTAAALRRQSGANLLVVGQREESALGVIASSLISLAAQHPADGGNRSASFYVLDGTLPDSEHAGYLASLGESLPHDVHVFGWRDAAEAIGAVADEVDRRIAAGDTEGPAIYLLAYNLGRFRDLRRDENDYSYGGFGDEEQTISVARRFVNILKEGAAFGVHTLVWCDSANALNRVLDRQSLREFELRVLFQMNPDDSSNLIDSPAATNLGPFRALFYSEEQGGLEKFRPYKIADSHWLDSVRKSLAQRCAAQTPDAL